MPIDFYYLQLSAPCESVLMLVNTLGVKLNLIETDLDAGAHLTPGYIKMNPQHCIPTMNDNGFILWESRAILGYLVDQYAKDDSLYPKDPKKRAVINQRLYFDIGTLYPKFSQYYSPILFEGKEPDPTHVAAFKEPIELLDKFLEGNEWVAGDNISIADYAIVTTISQMEGVGYDLSKHCNVARWFSNIKKSISSFDEVMISGVAGILELFRNAVKK